MPIHWSAQTLSLVVNCLSKYEASCPKPTPCVQDGNDWHQHGSTDDNHIKICSHGTCKTLQQRGCSGQRSPSSLSLSENSSASSESPWSLFLFFLVPLDFTDAKLQQNSWCAFNLDSPLQPALSAPALALADASFGRCKPWQVQAFVQQFKHCFQTWRLSRLGRSSVNTIQLHLTSLHGSQNQRE